MPPRMTTSSRSLEDIQNKGFNRCLIEAEALFDDKGEVNGKRQLYKKR